MLLQLHHNCRDGKFDTAKQVDGMALFQICCKKDYQEERDYWDYDQAGEARAVGSAARYTKVKSTPKAQVTVKLIEESWRKTF